MSDVKRWHVPYDAAIAAKDAEIERLRAALRRIYFLDHNEREWESVDEIKQFARAALVFAETRVRP